MPRLTVAVPAPRRTTSMWLRADIRHSTASSRARPLAPSLPTIHNVSIRPVSPAQPTLFLYKGGAKHPLKHAGSLT